jgi:hypothetical protein
MVAVALRSTAFLAAVFGAALFVAGLLAVAGRLAGGELGGAFTLVLAGGAGYVAHLLRRAAARAERNAERATIARRRAARLIGAATIVTGVGAVFVPAPTVVKVVGVASAALVAPIMFVRRPEPGPQRKR